MGTASRTSPRQTSSRLRLSNLSLTQAGHYWVVVRSPFGSVQSSEVSVTLLEFQPGTVNFANLTTPIFFGDTAERVPAGELFAAQLYAGAVLEEIEPIGPPVHFVAPGLFIGGIRTITTVRAGDTAWAQVRVWETERGETYEESSREGGIVGLSDVFQVTTGGYGFPPTPPAFLGGLTSFTIGNLTGVFPTQATFRPARLSGFRFTDAGFGFNLSGDAGARHRVDVSSDLVHWSLLIELPTSLETLFIVDPDASGFPIRYYRVISSE